MAGTPAVVCEGPGAGAVATIPYPKLEPPKAVADRLRA